MTRADSFLESCKEIGLYFEPDDTGFFETNFLDEMVPYFLVLEWSQDKAYFDEVLGMYAEAYCKIKTRSFVPISEYYEFSNQYHPINEDLYEPGQSFAKKVSAIAGPAAKSAATAVGSAIQKAKPMAKEVGNTLLRKAAPLLKKNNVASIMADAVKSAGGDLEKAIASLHRTAGATEGRIKYLKNPASRTEFEKRVKNTKDAAEKLQKTLDLKKNVTDKVDAFSKEHPKIAKAVGDTASAVAHVGRKALEYFQSDEFKKTLTDTVNNIKEWWKNHKIDKAQQRNPKIARDLDKIEDEDSLKDYSADLEEKVLKGEVRRRDAQSLVQAAKVRIVSNKVAARVLDKKKLANDKKNLNPKVSSEIDSAVETMGSDLPDLEDYLVVYARETSKRSEDLSNKDKYVASDAKRDLERIMSRFLKKKFSSLQKALDNDDSGDLETDLEDIVKKVKSLSIQNLQSSSESPKPSKGSFEERVKAINAELNSVKQRIQSSTDDNEKNMLRAEKEKLSSELMALYDKSDKQKG